MAAGQTPEGKTVDLISVFEGVGEFQTGKITAKQFKNHRRLCLPALPAVPVRECLPQTA